MKRVAFTVSISLAAFIVAAAVARSRILQQTETASYLGSNGWTLKRNIILKLPGSEPRIMGREELYFSADGRRRDVTYNIRDDGTEICQKTVVYTPGLGVFHEDTRSQRLIYIADYGGLGGDVDVNAAHKDPNYVSDQQILGYTCAYTRKVDPDGSVTEYYESYNFGRIPLKMVSQSSESTQTWEPTAIEIGGVSESALAYHVEWPVDFSYFEQRIQRRQSANPSDPSYAQQAERMRQELDNVKQRLSAQGFRIK
jgi:hypothetical protein